MILDGLLQFSGPNGDSPTTGATNASTNIIDLHLNAPGIPVLAAGQGARDMGIGDDPALKLLVQVVTAFVGGTSLAVALQGAPDNGSGAPGAFVTWWTGPAVALASLTVGARLYDMDMPRPPAGVPVPRFLQMNYAIGGTMTGGTIKAFIVIDRHDQMYNATANNVLGGYPPGVAVAN
jgi:hypothetical protein